jgi:hypothetical protein
LFLGLSAKAVFALWLEIGQIGNYSQIRHRDVLR